MIPSIGRIVHYILPLGPSAGQHRPALIVRVLDDQGSESSSVNLQVFTDDANDNLAGVKWVKGVLQDSKAEQPGTFHECEHVGSQVSQEEQDLALLERLEAAAESRDEAEKKVAQKPNGTAVAPVAPPQAGEQKPA